MSKHSLDFKLSVVEFYEKGKRSAREVCVHLAWTMRRFANG